MKVYWVTEMVRNGNGWEFPVRGWAYSEYDDACDALRERIREQVNRVIEDEGLECDNVDKVIDRIVDGGEYLWVYETGRHYVQWRITDGMM